MSGQLIECITCGDVSSALKLVENFNYNSQFTNMRGDCALVLACKYDYTTIAIKLIENAHINLQFANKYPRIALIWACSNSNTILAQKLIETGQCDIMCDNYVNRLPLLWACYNKMHTVVYALILTSVWEFHNISSDFCKYIDDTEFNVHGNDMYIDKFISELKNRI